MFNNRAYITDGFYTGSTQVVVFCYNANGTIIELQYRDTNNNVIATYTQTLSNYNATFTVPELRVRWNLRARIQGGSFETSTRFVIDFPEITYPPTDRETNPFVNVTFEQEKLSNFDNVIFTSEII